jgi:hypothetical protein
METKHIQHAKPISGLQLTSKRRNAPHKQFYTTSRASSRYANEKLLQGGDASKKESTQNSDVDELKPVLDV